MSSNIKISVITVCFNAVKTIEGTISSVLSQNYPNVEYIIVDGASTDGTIEIIKKQSDRINKFVSEKDKGIFDAMNKGIKLSTGDVLYFLNADDHLYDNTVLSDVAKAFSEDSSRLLVYGDILLKGAPQGIKIGRAFAFKKWSISEFLHNAFCHQAVFVRRSLFSDLGLFDCRYKYTADYLWIAKAFKYNPHSFYFLGRDVAYYFYGGRSNQQIGVTQREVIKIHFKYLFSLEQLWFFFRYIFVRRVKKFLLNEK